jgi:hypothetical protein
VKASVRGAQRLPGQSMACVTPFRAQSSAMSKMGCKRKVQELII